MTDAVVEVDVSDKLNKDTDLHQVPVSAADEVDVHTDVVVEVVTKEHGVVVQLHCGVVEVHDEVVVEAIVIHDSEDQDHAAIEDVADHNGIAVEEDAGELEARDPCPTGPEDKEQVRESAEVVVVVSEV